MDHSDIKQHVIDALGKILVDKSLIQERDDALLSELVLDEEDFADFFASLQEDFDIVLPQRMKSEISHLPENPDYSQLTLEGLSTLIQEKMKSRKPG
ncbi:hypothetical protein ACI2KS_27980 [Pseudomonas sp. NPDC087358]|jgi:hypothetical protein|uniref:hypothetical protein n=1 Tax=Pseudomonas sp. NPDC087358 TaxID=3364439 RepID=UPI003851740C